MKKTKQMIKTLCLTLALGLGVSTQAQTGAALNFDGVNDKVVIPTSAASSLAGNNKVTVEAWVRPTTTTGLGCVVGNYNSPGNNMQFMIRRENSSWAFWVGPGNVTSYTNTPTTAGTATVNVWQHVAGVYNGTVMTLYINGVVSATAATSNTFATSTNSVMIGGESPSEFFTGDIDEVRIWNIARSQADIQNSMNCEINGAAANLLANYHFNQGIAAGANAAVTTATDDSGNNYNGTLTAMTLTGATSNWIAPGGVTSGVSCNGAALNFNGTNNYVTTGVTITNSLTGSNKISAEAWVKPTNLTGLGSIVGNYNAPTVNGQMQFLLRRNGTTYEFFIGGGTSSTYGSVNSAANTATTGVWQHIAGTWDGAVGRIYVNGILSATATLAYPAFGAFSNQVWIGGRSGGEFFSGDIDEVRIWKRTLCQSEIQNNMNAELSLPQTSLVAYYNFNQGIAGVTNSAVTNAIDALGLNTGTLTNFALTGVTSNWTTPGGVNTGSTAASFVAITGPASICSSATAIFTASSIASSMNYTWSTAATTTSISVSPTVTTVYSVSATNSSGCVGSKIVTLTVNATPTISAASSASLICTGQTATLTANGATTYTWNTSATTSVIAISPTVTTSYTVTGSGANGCSNSAVISQSVSACTGIQNNNSAISAINLYPNPSTGIFTIDAESVTNIIIVDVLGKIIYTQNLVAGKNTINLSNFNNGLYILKAESNGVVKTVRVVKH